MTRTFIALGALLLAVPALAQQQPVPLTDWRAMLDTDLSKISMPRDAHQAVYSILQAYERQARQQAAPPPQIEERK